MKKIVLVCLMLFVSFQAHAANKGYALINDSDQVLDGTGTPIGLPRAYSSLWFHGAESTTTISTQVLFTQLTDFGAVGNEDINTNAVGSTSTDDITIGANGAGVYDIRIEASFRNGGGGSSDMYLAPGITLATPIAIASSTDATPIVVATSSAHGLKTGDAVRIAGHNTNVAANTDCAITVTDTTHFSLQDLAHVNIAGSGSGVGSGGNVTVIFPGEIALHRKVSQTDLGRGAARGTWDLAVSDVVELYIANEDGTDNFISVQHVLGVFRIE